MILPRTFQQILLVLIGITPNIFAQLNGIPSVLLPPKQESIVDIPGLGKIKGLIKKYKDNPTQVYYQYKGIPFANKATRFELCRPVEPWTGVFDATVDGNVCPQPTGNIQFPGAISEDCLNLKISTPQDPNNITTKLPVLVFIHGGGYLLGTSRSIVYDPEFLLPDGIIVVQPNYRLGAFGWISDGNIIPKNIGLKDVVCALKFVQNYIEAFGGDPNAVTISGESAGSGIVSILWHANEIVAGLFRSVFMQSGVAISPWVIQKQPDLAYKNVLTKTSCSVTTGLSTQAQVECLKNLLPTELTTSDFITLGLNDIIDGQVLGGLNSGIVLEDPADPDAIVVRKPLEQLKNGLINHEANIMISITNEEMFTFFPIAQSFMIKPNSSLVPLGMKAPVDQQDSIGGIIRNHYTNNGNLDSYIKYLSDITMNIPTRRFIELVYPVLTDTASIYVLQFSYVSNIGEFNDKIQRVGHADDLFYTWQWKQISLSNLLSLTFSKESLQKRKEFNRFITNFVKYGEPTVVNDDVLKDITWSAVSNDKQSHYLDFNKQITEKDDLKNENYKFWMDLYEEYGNNGEV